MNFGIIYSDTPDCSVRMTDLKLDHDSQGYYLSAKYRIEDKHSVRELEFPKIRLNVDKKHVQFKSVGVRPEVDIGFGFCPLNHQGSRPGIYYTERILKEKVREMTVEEIEKALGHRVKIVGK